MKYPLIDRRNKEDIKEQIKKMASFYIPQWNPGDEGEDLGEALVDVFAQMFAGTIASVNRLPYKNYVNFLNFIGLKLLAGSPARGYVTVKLNQGAEPGIYIKRGTQIYVDRGADIGQVLYETENDIFAVDNEVNSVYCVNSLKNSIVNPYHKEAQQPYSSIRLFDYTSYDNLQQHILYMNSTDILNINQGARVEIQLKNWLRQGQEMDMAALLADENLFAWCVLTPKGWVEVDNVNYFSNRVSLLIDGSVPLLPFNQQEGRWIKCEFKGLEALPEILVENLGIAARAENIQPDYLLNNDLQLNNSNYLPFGENFSVYDDFCIGSEEAFTKKGSIINISFDLSFESFLPYVMFEEEEKEWNLIMYERHFQEVEPKKITIEEIVWEYWNGDGWARLIFDESLETVFKPEDTKKEVKRVNISFVCPEDFASNYVNAYDNYWIRARIMKVNNAFKPNTVYLSPLIKEIAISYHYRSEVRDLDNVMLEKNLTMTPMEFYEKKEQMIFSEQTDPEVATYFCLENPVLGGPITLYFYLVKMKEKSLHPIKWQYLGIEQGREKWLELKVSDETRMLSQSGLLTLIGKSNFAKASFFGQEGYWLRALNSNNSYDGVPAREIPEIAGIYFNTVKVQQQETLPVEYFTIESHQPDKICDLIGENLVWLEVWVDEQDRLTEQELNFLLEEGEHPVKFTRDDADNKIKTWVKWKSVEDLLLAGPEERCFIADPYSGRVTFGNGQRGKIPPGGEGDTIKIIYKTSKGEHGNLRPGEIQDFADAVPYVNEIYNAEPILGGCGREAVRQALDRGPDLIKNQNLAVAEEDYLSLVKQADRNIVKVKCFAHKNPDGFREVGAITIAFLPAYYNSEFSYFNKIKENVLNKIKETAPCVVAHSNKIYVVEVSYLEINVDMKLVIGDYNEYQSVIQQVEEKLMFFMDPVKGNYDGKGWDIGSYPNREKLYNIVKMVHKIRRIDSIHLTASLLTHEDRQPVDLTEEKEHPLSVPVCGEINLDIIVEPGL